MYQRAHARERHVGKLRQRLHEHFDIAGEKRAQHQPGVELAALAQMANERPDLVIGRSGCERHGRLLASFPVTRWARSRSSHSRAATKPASVSDSFATSAWRVAAGKSSRCSIASRMAAR